MNKAAKRLKTEVLLLPELSTDRGHASERTWHEHVNEIRRLILEDDPARFLTWRPIVSTMAARGHEDWSQIAYRYLERLPDWKSRWWPAIAEVPVGEPACHDGIVPPTTSASMIAAHCLAQFEQETGARIADLKFVFEFGGGYGCLCRLLYELGFEGDYLDYDFPVMAALARYYLDEVGLYSEGGSISFVSDLEQLVALLDGRPSVRHSLFLSHWALSETPVPLRSCILSLVEAFEFYSIVFQGEFREVDNVQFFKRLPAKFQDVHWYRWRMEHLGARVFAGARKLDPRQE